MSQAQAAIIDYYEQGGRGWHGAESDNARFAKLEADGNFRFYRAANLNLGEATKRFSVNWRTEKTVFGKFLENIPQEIGDCTSWGGRNGLITTGASNILVRRLKEIMKLPFPPYIYGCTRVQVENNGAINRGGDGANPADVAVALMKYGTVYTDDLGVPAYSGAVAKDYGRNGPPKEQLEMAKDNLVKSAVRVKTFEDALWQAVNGYGMFIGADFGYQMMPDKDGFHRPGRVWSHQMELLDVDDEWSTPFVLIRNSWGDAHGRLKDFRTGEDLPPGVLRVRKSDFLDHLAASCTYALCQYEQPISQDITDAQLKFF